MAQKTVALSINASWNIVNFRTGLIKDLQRQGYRVVALAPVDSYSPKLQALGVDHIPIPMDSKGVSPIRDLILLGRYWRVLRRLRPDVFLGYTAKPNIYGSLAAHSLGIAVINNVSGLGTAFIRDDLLTRIVTGLYRLAFRRSATVFFQNEEDFDMFLAAGMVTPAQARLLPGSGVDLERFSPAAAPGEASAFRFLLIARLLWFKGIGEYAEAARLIRRQGRDARFQLLGFLDPDNPNGVPKDQVLGWVKEGIVDYLGESDDVRPFIAEADCVVLPSYREGMPRTLLEASAMGKPLIATDVAGCRQLVEHDLNGFLCAPRDAGSLAEAMLDMLRLSPARREEMGQAARAKAESQFDERIAIGLYQEAIAAALGSGTRRSADFSESDRARSA
ncbi:glycosyltransferase family 4 protein [Sphingosinicella rhizophila]|uniref:Glycosyltransferase family 4 protein n=1 Tax=Sphingosinicella rhizophila TaxID=3050082 RepID=A0ABU3Q9M5_9SPHN|nr:glycosyltransferase family 4 protein [Sphingosinicella sp. GR2756]MDT9599698.1 glycosyltransferase family 4 protein [Sphingosinicella sp. GR2756]